MKTSKLVAIIIASVVGGGAVMLALIVAAVFILVPDDFASEAEKKDAFEKWACIRAAENPSWAVTSASTRVLSQKGANSEDRLIALKISVAALNNNLDSPTFDPPVPLTPTPDEDGVCYGWVWENYLPEQRSKHYDTFTYEEAKTAGVVN